MTGVQIRCTTDEFLHHPYNNLSFSSGRNLSTACGVITVTDELACERREGPGREVGRGCSPDEPVCDRLAARRDRRAVPPRQDREPRHEGQTARSGTVARRNDSLPERCLRASAGLGELTLYDGLSTMTGPVGVRPPHRVARFRGASFLFLSSSTAEHPAVNRRVAGSNPA